MGVGRGRILLRAKYCWSANIEWKYCWEGNILGEQYNFWGIFLRKVLWGKIFLDGLMVGKNCKGAHCILWGCFDGSIARGKCYAEYLWK